MICLPFVPFWLLIFAGVVLWMKRGGRIRIVAAIDGDTLLGARGFERARRLRLAGVDAPELGTRFGERAKAWVDTRVNGRWVPARVCGVDVHERPLVYVTVNGVDLGEALLLAGLARAMPFRHERQGAYLAAERLARRERRGMWTKRRRSAERPRPEPRTAGPLPR